MSRYVWTLLLSILLLLAQPKIQAGVTNPDFSAIGQFSLAYTDDHTEQPTAKPTLGLGEVEFVLDAPLNPYLNGAFVFSISEDEFEIEESYATLNRGLPLNIGLKGGKYRIGFGRLNPAHPHTYPFIRTPHVVDPGSALLLPGDESLNDVGLQASTLIPVIGNYAVLISADLLKGDSFHPDTTTADFGWIGRIVNSFIIADQAPSEFGLSLTQGTPDPINKTKTLVAGADLKTKITISPSLSANSTVRIHFQKD